MVPPFTPPLLLTRPLREELFLRFPLVWKGISFTEEIWIISLNKFNFQASLPTTIKNEAELTREP